MLFLHAAWTWLQAEVFKKPVGTERGTRSRQQSKRGYLAQDCQRRQSQASIEPVCVTLCFLMKNMYLEFSLR